MEEMSEGEEKQMLIAKQEVYSSQLALVTCPQG